MQIGKCLSQTASWEEVSRHWETLAVSLRKENVILSAVFELDVCHVQRNFLFFVNIRIEHDIAYRLILFAEIFLFQLA